MPTDNKVFDPRVSMPEFSLVMPCYNEEDCLRETAPALVDAFQDEGIRLELVLVDNGSMDTTGQIIDELIDHGMPVTKVTIPVNLGYGNGIRMGLEACSAPIIGYMCADGQVAPEDAVRAYRLMAGREERVLAKVRRRFRQDSWKRKIVSINYNVMMFGAFGNLGAIDVNGSPKIFSRSNFDRMRLKSDDWFLDPEIIIKTKELGLRVIEFDVEGYARRGGFSNVRRSTIVEFMKNMWRYKFGKVIRDWKAELESDRKAGKRVPKTPSPPQQPKPSWRESIRHAGISGVRVVQQNRHEDPRGFLQKVLRSSQCDGRPPRGEVYVTSARKGEAKGNHYHLRMGEWFAIVQGEGSLELCDPVTGGRMSVRLSTQEPLTVYVPAGLAHAVVNNGDGELICIAWAEAEHDPSDVHAYQVWPPVSRTGAAPAKLEEPVLVS